MWFYVWDLIYYCCSLSVTTLLICYSSTCAVLEGFRGYPHAITPLTRFTLVYKFSLVVFVILSFTHSVQSLAFIESPIPVGPSLSSMTQKEVCQSAMQFTKDFFVYVLKSVKNCVIIVIFKWCHVFLFVHIFSPGLLNLLCSAHLSFPPLLWFQLFSHLYLCLFVFSIQAGQQSFREIQLNLSRFDYYFTVYPVGFSLTLCLPDIPNWTFYPVTHFSWQTSSPKVYLWAICCEGQRHKSSTRFLNN